MAFGVELGNFCLFKGQLIELGIDIDHRIQHRLRLKRQIDRIFILTEGVELVLGFVQMTAHFRELFRQKLETFGRLFRLALHVLRLVVAGDAVENVADLVLIFPGKGQTQHPGIFPGFGDRQVALQVVNHPQHREFADGELAAGLGTNVADHHAHAVFLQHLPYLAAGAKPGVAGELILVFIQHLEGKDLAGPPGGQRKGGYFYGVVLPAHQPIPARAKHREGVFADADVEIEIVHGFTQHQAGLDQLDFRLRGGRLVRQRRTDVLHQRTAAILLNLHQRVGAVDWGGEEGVNHCRHGKHCGDTQHPPARLYHGADQATNINFITARTRGGRRFYVCCHYYPC